MAFFLFVVCTLAHSSLFNLNVQQLPQVRSYSLGRRQDFVFNPFLIISCLLGNQFILEEYPKEAKIVVCQPRRLAATGVATRVAEERGESRPGDQSVGYVVRGDSAMCKNSRLVFCTTGVLLRQLQNESALSCLTHIVIDEVSSEMA